MSANGVTEQDIEGHIAPHAIMSAGMKIMGVMMAMYMGGLVLGVSTPLLGTGAFAVAVPLAIVFGAVTLTQPRLMGLLMALCCGGGVLVGTIPALGILLAVPLALLVAVVVVAGHEKLMGHGH